MHAQDQLLLVLHDVPTTDEMTRIGVLYWRDRQGEWHASDGAPGKDALQQHLQRYAKRLEEFDQLEHSAQSADQYSRLLEGLAPGCAIDSKLAGSARRSTQGDAVGS